MKEIYWSLFATFMKIGGFTFGGGYAMIPIIHAEVVEQKGWLTEDDMVDILAIAESTPGPIAINSATFIGYKKGGLLGSALATLGVVLPSFLMILLISLFFTQFREAQWVGHAFAGIRAGVVFLVIGGAKKLISKVHKNPQSYATMALVFLLATFTPVNVVWLLLASAALYIFYHPYEAVKKGEKK